MTETDDNKFMRRCIELASGAEGMTYPNPMVGSVIVHNGNIIGEGFHLKSGESHAEVIAINSVSEKNKLKDSTLYVNLEPCSHFGKTPPCADYIIENKIPRVVIGTIDSNDRVSGRGVKKLMAAGCEVKTGFLESECRRLNRRFFSFHEKRRPYITLKWAQSADGYLDMKREPGLNPRPNWITGKPERILVHKWRAAEQAILVGAGTVRADAPRLDVREWSGANPLKLILSSSGNVRNETTIHNTDSKVIVLTHNSGAVIPDAEVVTLNKEKLSSVQIADFLYSRGIQSLFIEGGADILNHFIETGIWDEARIFTGEDFFFNDGVKAPAISGHLFSKTTFSKSTLEIYLANVR
jgi:diaminohydroxyphosphoribosylaminopyrimidine deaminase/5-amino-6-(5-phosphoribosylamino)uracil reductase